MSPEKTPNQSKISRSLGISLGVTEWIFLLGLILLAAGICLIYGFAWMFIAVGVLLVLTALWIQHELDKGK